MSFLGFLGRVGVGLVIDVLPWYKPWYSDFFYITKNQRMLIGRLSFYRDHREFPGNKATPART